MGSRDDLYLTPLIMTSDHRATASRVTPHVLDIPFAMRPVATAHAARWDASRGVFIYEGDKLPPALAPFRALSYSWEMHVQRELTPIKRAARPPVAAIKLRAHQEAAVKAIAAARAAKLPGFLLADDVGKQVAKRLAHLGECSHADCAHAGLAAAACCASRCSSLSIFSNRRALARRRK